MDCGQGCREYTQGRHEYKQRTSSGVALALLTCVGLLLMSGAAFAASYKVEAENDGYDGEWSRGHWWTGIYVPNLTRLDEELMDNGFDPLDAAFFLWGGGTFSERARFGVAGIAGAGNVSSTRGTRRAQLSTGFGLVEAAYLWPGRGWHVQAGAMLGVGGSSLILSEGRPTSREDAYRWRYDTHLTHAFMLMGPSLGARFDLSRSASMHMNTGYLFALSGPWTHRGSDMTFSGAPDMSGSFFMIGFTQRFGRGTYNGPKPYGKPHHHRRRW